MLTPNLDRINPAVCVNAKLRKLHRILNTAYQAKINPFGLRGSMLSILFIIGKRPGSFQKFIADALVLDQSTMSRDLKRLRQKGWITSVKGEDSRFSALYLTDQGAALLEQIIPVWESLQAKISEVFGTYDVKQIDRLITTLKLNIEDIKS